MKIFYHFRELTEPECDRGIAEFKTAADPADSKKLATLEKIRKLGAAESAKLIWNSQINLEDKYVIRV